MTSLRCTVLAEVPAVPESVRSLRRTAERVAAEAGAPQPKVADIALAVSEAATNAVVHAYRTEPGTLALAAERDGDTVVFRVIDHGEGLTPRADSPGLGLGLPLIARLADRFEVRPGPSGRGTELCMEFKTAAS